MKIFSNICWELLRCQILIDCKFFLLQVYYSILQKVYTYLLFKIYRHSCIIHYSIHVNRTCCSSSKDSFLTCIFFNKFFNQVLYHLPGLNRMQEVRPLLSYERIFVYIVQFLRAFTILFISLKKLLRRNYNRTQPRAHTQLSCC